MTVVHATRASPQTCFWRTARTCAIISISRHPPLPPPNANTTPPPPPPSRWRMVTLKAATCHSCSPPAVTQHQEPLRNDPLHPFLILHPLPLHPSHPPPSHHHHQLPDLQRCPAAEATALTELQSEKGRDKDNLLFIN